MQNVEIKVVKNILTIEIDLSQDYGLSKSGKSTTVASTRGFTKVDETRDISLNLNCIKKV